MTGPHEEFLTYAVRVAEKVPGWCPRTRDAEEVQGVIVGLIRLAEVLDAARPADRKAELAELARWRGQLVSLIRQNTALRAAQLAADGPVPYTLTDAGEAEAGGEAGGEAAS